jgi:hypothetical protein
MYKAATKFLKTGRRNGKTWIILLQQLIKNQQREADNDSKDADIDKKID